MDTDSISFKTLPYFPIQIKLLWSLGLLTFALIFTQIFPFPILLLSWALMLAGAAAIWTTHYRVDIDFLAGSVHDHLWILGYRKGKARYFDTIEFLFLSRIKVSQGMNLWPQSTTVKEDMYDGYIKFSKKHKIHILTKPSKKAALKEIQPLAQKMGLRLVDFTGKKPVEIELNEG